MPDAPTPVTCVVGLGYVGLPLAVALTEAGHRVIGLESDKGRVAAVNAGRSPTPDIADARLAQCVRSGLEATTDPAQVAPCTTVIICVPTPLTEAGAPDTSHIDRAVKAIAPHLARGTLIILESTSYPGTTEELVGARLQALTGLEPGTDFCLAFSPERIDPGNDTFSIESTPKIVAGLRACCQSRATDIYTALGIEVVHAKGIREAELAKLLENTYRQVNIALVNELARFSRALDIDIHEAIRCAATKPFGFHAFYPGPGVGGHCIPVDPMILASRVDTALGESFRLVHLAQEINKGMPRYAVDRLITVMAEHETPIQGARVVILGVAYKRDIPDTRDSPSEDVARILRRYGATISFIDPWVDSWIVDGVSVPRSHLEDGADRADAAILLTDHSAFTDRDISHVAPIVLDTRGRLHGAHVAQM